MKNLDKNFLFKQALEKDNELDLAIGTDKEQKVIEEASEIMEIIERNNLREEFDKYVQEI